LSSGYGGVPLDQLCCPTCGDLFTDYTLHSDPDDFDLAQIQVLGIMSRVRQSKWYILCPNRHKWTVKTLFRAQNAPDAVLLGEYLGDG